jgi:hypothetical protein
MTSFINSKFHFSHTINQLCKGQDYVCTGSGINPETGEPFEWIMLNDGHGSNACINCIRQISTNEKSKLISEPDPIRAIASYIDSYCFIRFYESSGATAIVIKFYADRAECINCGDSQFIIFKDDDIIHISEEHIPTKPEEKIRMLQMGITFKSSTNIKVASESVIISIPSEYAVFKNGNHLACSQALGHNSMTGYNPSSFILPFESDASYRFVLGSDGLFDMLMLENPSDIEILKTKTSKEICDWAAKRWQQQWECYSPTGEKHLITFSKEEVDDVSVAVVIKPKTCV